MLVVSRELGSCSTEVAMYGEIQHMAVRSVSDIAKTAGKGIFSRDDGARRTKVRGQRSGSSVTFIDGVKVVGNGKNKRQSQKWYSENG